MLHNTQRVATVASHQQMNDRHYCSQHTSTDTSVTTLYTLAFRNTSVYGGRT